MQHTSALSRAPGSPPSPPSGLCDLDRSLHRCAWSLRCLFWLQAGQTEDAAALHGNWTAAWSAFGWLPELFDASVTQRHPLQTVSPVTCYFMF